MKTRENTVPVSAARQELPELIKKVRKLHNYYFITTRGRVDGVIMSAEEFEGWSETMDIIFNRAEMRSFRRALADIQKGRVKTFKEVFGEDL